jgi:hypothetical protein
MGALKEATEYSEKAKNLIDEMRAYSSNCGQKKNQIV